MTGTETPAESTPLQKPQLSIEILAPLDIESLAETFKKFEEFKSRLLKQEDYQKIGSKQFIKKSGWRKWALACAVSDEILEKTRVPPIGTDTEGSFYYTVTVRAFHLPTGRSAVGVAVASRSEKQNWAHPEHDILTLCHTRAKNRAISDLVGGGEVSAEEVSTDSAAIETQKPQHAWHVTDNAAANQIRQEPVFHKTATVGTVSIDEQHNECAFVPEAELRADAGPISNFLERKILVAMREKHPEGFDYAIDVVDGRLRAVLVRGALDGDRFKELLDAVGWAFAKAAEQKIGGEAR